MALGMVAAGDLGAGEVTVGDAGAIGALLAGTTTAGALEAVATASTGFLDAVSSPGSCCTAGGALGCHDEIWKDGQCLCLVLISCMPRRYDGPNRSYGVTRHTGIDMLT